MNPLSGLSGMRGLAAIIVVIYHLNQQLPTTGLSSGFLSVHNFIARLSLVVSVFFFLSGFFRAMSYWKVIDIPEKTPEFWSSLKDRFLRIAPAYYFALVVSIIATWIIHGYTSISMPAILAGFTFTTWFAPETLFPVILNGPLWFVSFDMMGWILTSLVMMGYVRLRQRGTMSIWKNVAYFTAIFVLFLGLHFLWIHLPWQPTTAFPANYWFPLYNPFLFFLHFLLGIIGAGIVALMRKKEISFHWKYDIGFLTVLLIGGIFIWNIRDVWDDFAYSYPTGPYYFPWVQILIALGCGFLPFTRYIGKWLDNRFFLFTAGLSYSLYLIHGVIIALLLGYIFSGGLTLGTWTLFALSTIIISYISAFLMHRFIEK